MESGYIFMFDMTGLSKASRSAEILKPSQLKPHTTSYNLIFPSHLSPQPLLQPSCGHALPRISSPSHPGISICSVPAIPEALSTIYPHSWPGKSYWASRSELRLHQEVFLDLHDGLSSLGAPQSTWACHCYSRDSWLWLLPIQTVT